MCRPGCSASSAEGSCSCTRSPANQTAGSWRLFAFQRDDEHNATDMRRERLPQAKLAEAVEWALSRGADTVLLELDTAKPFHPEIVHHECFDPGCPGGCRLPGRPQEAV